VVPVLAFEASYQLLFDFAYLHPAVADCESPRQGSIGSVNVSEGENQVCRSLGRRSSCYWLYPPCGLDGFRFQLVDLMDFCDVVRVGRV
jgi:hypothetical protein